MVNQRGQAFSVFELMIAAIVAIAILFVLLPIVNNITAPTGDALSEIGNTLSATNFSKKETATFEIEPKATIRSSNFSNKGIDECSFYFEKGRFSDNQIEINFDDDFDDGCDFYMVNLTSNPIRAKATIICDSDADDLDNSIENAGIEVENSPTDVWGSDEDYLGFDKVCVVILKRAS